MTICADFSSNAILWLFFASVRPMTKKPDRQTAMRNIIDAVKKELPLYESETFVCGPKGECVGCPKKLLEMVDGELSYWDMQ